MSQSTRSLRFCLDAASGADHMTIRAFSILIEDEPVWPMIGMAEAALDIPVDDLLSYLAEFWKPLLLRQVYPAAFNPYRPSALRSVATQRWNEVPIEVADREEEAVLAFEEAHDLSRAFAGLFDLPSFWLLRSGDQFLCETQGRIWKLAYDDVAGALIELGNAIEVILSDAGDKWLPLIDAWHCRYEGCGVQLLAWSLGIDMDTSEALLADGSLEEPKDFADAANDNDELRIAARMAGALPIDQIQAILSIAGDFEHRDAPLLVDFASSCSGAVVDRYASHPPYVQGEVAARSARELFGIGPDDCINIREKIVSLGVQVEAREVQPEDFDGLAIWGSKHGPGVFINLASQRISNGELPNLDSDPAIRVTLAHEFCHLLLDGRHAVSAVDVLKSRMPVAIEQRAKSFAGEVLLPGRTAARWWDDHGSPTDREGLRRVLLELERAFLVPRAVSAWKLDHGLQFRDIDLSVQLNNLSRYR